MTALIALAGLGWALLGGSSGRDGATTAGAPSTAGVATTGIRLVAYQGEDILGGKTVDLGSILGHGKPVVVNFFAGLCPPCRAEMPGFERVYEHHAGRFILLGADIGPFVGLGSHDDARRLLSELGITYPAAFVQDDPVQQIGVVGMPTTILYDAHGREVARHTGLITEDQLEQEIGALIANGP